MSKYTKQKFAELEVELARLKLRLSHLEDDNKVRVKRAVLEINSEYLNVSDFLVDPAETAKIKEILLVLLQHFGLRLRMQKDLVLVNESEKKEK